MLQAKSFPIEKTDELNEFIKTHSPRGDNGIKITSNNIIVFYEDGHPMNTSDKVQSLRFELGKHRESILQYDKQYRTNLAIYENSEELLKQAESDTENLKSDIEEKEKEVGKSKKNGSNKEISKMRLDLKSKENFLLQMKNNIAGIHVQVVTSKRQLELEKISERVVEEMISELDKK